MQIDNGSEKIEFSNKLAKKLTKEDLGATKSGSVEETIFKSIDTDGKDGITTEELAKFLTNLDGDGDGKVTDEEIKTAVDKIDNVKAEKKTQYVAFIKKMAEQNTAKVQNSENVGNSYVIQLGEQLDEKNLTKTDDKSGKWYYSNNEKVHYYWNGSEFIKAPGTSGAVIKEDGTFELTSGVKLRATYGTKDGWYYDQKSGNHYWYDQKTNHFINTGLKVSIDKDGTFTTASGHKLRATFGTASGWYYEVNTNPPVHWKKEGNKFYSHPEIKMIKEDGTIVNN